MPNPNFPQIQFGKMLDMPRGTVLEEIPPNERDKYYLRGASLGTLAINLAYAVNRINPRNDLLMHVSPDSGPDAYAYTYYHARSLAEYGLPQHFNDQERAVLSQLSGRDVVAAPAIVLGIPRDHPGLEFTSHSDGGLSDGGLVVKNEVPFADLDPYSQAALSDIFGIDIARLPSTPGAQGPQFARPKLSMGRG